MTDAPVDAGLTAQATALQQEWCHAIDGQDLDGIQRLFAPGGTLLTRGRLMDATERAQFFVGMWAESPARSTHVCREVHATQTADGVWISARLAATFIFPDGSIRVAWGNYDDRARPTDDGLRLIAKKITLERIEFFTEDRHGVRPELDHVALALQDGQLERLMALFTEGLGGTLIGGGLEPHTGLRSAQVTFAGGGKVELLEATRDGPVREFVATRGPGMHHLTVLVEDVDATIDRLRSAGYRTLGRSEPSSMWHEAYVHPRDAGGCLIQLVRAGAGYGAPVPITAQDILADRWTWVERVPQPVTD